MKGIRGKVGAPTGKGPIIIHTVVSHHSKLHLDPEGGQFSATSFWV